MFNKNILLIDSKIGDLIDNPISLTGGATIQTNSWLSGFIDLGFDVHLITERIPQRKNDYHFINLFSSKYYSIFYIPILVIRLIIIFKRYKFKFIYVSTAGWQTFIYGLASKLTGTIYVQRVSNNIVYDPLIYRRRLGLLKYYLSVAGTNYANIILVQNLQQYSNLKRLYPKKIIHIMHNPYKNNSKNPKESLNGDYVAWIGIFQHQKNLSALYDIANELPEINFKIAGAAGQEIDQNSIEALEKLKRLSNVKFVGKISRDEISSFLSNSFCLLNTSHYEGFSNTFLEALESGRPIVTTRKVDPDSIIEKYNLGYVADSYKEIPELLIEACANYKIFFKHNRRYLEEYHNPIVLAKKLIKYIENGSIKSK